MSLEGLGGNGPAPPAPRPPLPAGLRGTVRAGDGDGPGAREGRGSYSAWTGGFLRSADGLFITDERQRVVLWSSSAERILGHSAAEVVGRRCYEVIAGTEPSGHPICRRGCRPVTNAMHGRVTPDYDVVARNHCGDRVCLNNSIILLIQPGARPLHLLHLFRHRTGEALMPELSAAGPAAMAARLAVQPLSRREFEVLRLLATGRVVAEIAQTLSISPYTARNHVNSIERKLGARSRLEAVILAARHSLL